MKEVETLPVEEDTAVPTVDALIVTAVNVELTSVLATLKPLEGRSKILKMPWQENTYFVGTLGACPVAVVIGEAGSTSRQGSALLVADSVARWRPRAVIMVGIACGRESDQVLGDVLVSTQIIPYQFEKLTEQRAEDRAPRPEASATLLDRVKTLLWEWESGSQPRGPVFGPILSGDRLVNSKKFVEELYERFPNAVGIEMEGAGLYAGAARRGADWILIKGVCDWGHHKDSNAQQLAASNAVQLVVTLLNEPGIFSGLRRYGRPDTEQDVGALRQLVLKLAFNDTIKRIRNAEAAQHATAQTLATIVSKAITGQDGTAILAHDQMPPFQLAVAANNAAMETWLNAHEDAAAGYLLGSIDPGLYRTTIAAEVRQIFEKESPAREMVQRSGYECLKQVYQELFQSLLSP